MRRRIKRALVSVALTATAVSGTAGWAVGSEQTPVTGPPPGAAAWRADTVDGAHPPDPEAATPAEVASFFAGLTPARQQDLADRHPLTVGNLDGAPVELRYQANRRALRLGWHQARSKAADPALSAPVRDRERERADRYRELCDPARQILAFDPRGRGQVAEVFGDLARAERTAVAVPGSDIDLMSFDDTGENEYGTPAGMAKSLRERMAREAPETRTATIAWAGYTTPVGIGPDAATARLAEAGAPRLEGLLDGLAQTGTARPTVFCHSYGSVVCGEAAHRVDREQARNLVVFGSPGMGVDSASALETSVPVWAARADGDWIGKVPSVRLFGLGHSTDPTSTEFGARVVTTDGGEGHAGYFEPGSDSLSNFARIALGSYDAVRCTSDSQKCGG